MEGWRPKGIVVQTPFGPWIHQKRSRLVFGWPRKNCPDQQNISIDEARTQDHGIDWRAFPRWGDAGFGPGDVGESVGFLVSDPRRVHPAGARSYVIDGRGSDVRGV